MVYILDLVLDVENGDFDYALTKIGAIDNLTVQGLHFHISRARGLDSWKNRIVGLLELVKKYNLDNLKYIDLGSGMYGKLDPELQEQFGINSNICRLCKYCSG